MCDADDAQVPAAEAADGLLDHLLRCIVQSTGGFIQEQKRCTLHQGPRDGDTLFLTARQLTAPSSYEGMVLLRQGLNKSQLRPGKVLFGGARITLHDVVMDGACKEDRLLAHITNTASQSAHLEVLHVLPVHQHQT